MGSQAAALKVVSTAPLKVGSPALHPQGLPWAARSTEDLSGSPRGCLANPPLSAAPLLGAPMSASPALQLPMPSPTNGAATGAAAITSAWGAAEIAVNSLL